MARFSGRLHPKFTCSYKFLLVAGMGDLDGCGASVTWCLHYVNTSEVNIQLTTLSVSLHDIGNYDWMKTGHLWNDSDKGDAQSTKIKT